MATISTTYTFPNYNYYRWHNCGRDIPTEQMFLLVTFQRDRMYPVETVLFPSVTMSAFTKIK